jgi:membrane dipeptidase
LSISANLKKNHGNLWSGFKIPVALITFDSFHITFQHIIMENFTPQWSRRKFITASSGAGAAILLSPLFSWAKGLPDPMVAKIVESTFGIDTHNHMDVPFNKEEFSALQYDLATEIKRSGLTAICMTFCVDRPNLLGEGEAYRRFLASIDEMDVMLKANKIKRALNFSDVIKAHQSKIPIVIQSVEGGHFIEGKLERIQVAFDRGLRHLGLMHDGQSTPPLGDIYTDQPKYDGMTEYGLSIVKECNRLGILIDLAHCSDEAVNDVLAVATKPILISHTGLNTQLGSNERMSKMMMSRLISVKQAKIVAGAGGVIGVWTHLADSPLEYAKNIRAMVDVVGIDHVCMGTDTKMAPPTGSSGRAGNKTNEAWQGQQEGFYYTVVDALLKTGFTKDEIGKIGGDNYFRILDAATHS